MDTREIAKIVNMTHDKLIRKLEGSTDRKGYIEILTNAQMGVSKYFIESSYVDSSGKENKCYECTKMGCEFLANKFTGEKGVIFTAKYVERYNTMETLIKKNRYEVLLEQNNEQIHRLEMCIGIHDRHTKMYIRYIKNKLGIIRANKDYLMIKKNLFKNFGIDKWEDLALIEQDKIFSNIDSCIQLIEGYKQLEMNMKGEK
nr:MAG TPA: regulatory protein [Caudoviricetes sp.]